MSSYSELTEAHQDDIDQIIDVILALPEPTDEQRAAAEIVGDPVWRILSCVKEDIRQIGFVRERAKASGG